MIEIQACTSLAVICEKIIENPLSSTQTLLLSRVFGYNMNN